MPAALASTLQEVVNFHRTFDGKIWDVANQVWIDATPASLDAADAAAQEVIGVALDLITFPIDLGAVGAITRAQADAVVPRLDAAMKAYAQATTV